MKYMNRNVPPSQDFIEAKELKSWRTYLTSASSTFTRHPAILSLDLRCNSANHISLPGIMTEGKKCLCYSTKVVEYYPNEWIIDDCLEYQIVPSDSVWNSLGLCSNSSSNSRSSSCSNSSSKRSSSCSSSRHLAPACSGLQCITAAARQGPPVSIELEVNSWRNHAWSSGSMTK